MGMTLTAEVVVVVAIVTIMETMKGSIGMMASRSGDATAMEAIYLVAVNIIVAKVAMVLVTLAVVRTMVMAM